MADKMVNAAVKPAPAKDGFQPGSAGSTLTTPDQNECKTMASDKGKEKMMK